MCPVSSQRPLSAPRFYYPSKGRSSSVERWRWQSWKRMREDGALMVWRRLSAPPCHCPYVSSPVPGAQTPSHCPVCVVQSPPNHPDCGSCWWQKKGLGVMSSGEYVVVCMSRLPWQLVSGTPRGRAGDVVCCWGKTCHWSVHVVEVNEWEV